MKVVKAILFLFLILSSCVSQYMPEISEYQEAVVVEGLITDQPGPYVVKIRKVIPVWQKYYDPFVDNCNVWLTDDLGNTEQLRIVSMGVYETDSASFRGRPGRTYTLHFTGKINGRLQNYESLPMLMIPVPPVDSLYYEKLEITYNNLPAEGCRIYMNCHDLSDSCRFFRWNYTETWEIRNPFDIVNKVCWVSEKSSDIMIKNTSLLGTSTVVKYPLNTISNPVDRLSIRYSILVNQYSLNEIEYDFWEKIRNIQEQVGGLYDIVPSTVTGNIYGQDNKLEKVLGFFSVSAVKSRRLFIDNDFKQSNGLYMDCITDSVYYIVTPNLEGWVFDPSYVDLTMSSNIISPGEWNNTWWSLYEYPDTVPPMRVVTNKRFCGDCTSRGSTVRPDYWDYMK